MSEQRLEEKIRSLLTRMEDRIEEVDLILGDDDDSGLGDQMLGEREGLAYAARMLRRALGLKLRKGNGG